MVAVDEYADGTCSSYKQQVQDLSLSYEEAVRYAEERQPYWLSLRHPRDSEMEWDLFDYFPAAHYKTALDQAEERSVDGRGLRTDGGQELHKGTRKATVYYWLDPDTGAALHHTGVNEERTIPFFPDEESARDYLDKRADTGDETQYEGLSLYKARTRKVGDAVDVLTDQAGIEDFVPDSP